MKYIYIYIILFSLCSASHADDEESNFTKIRLNQVQMIKTKSFEAWPKDSLHLYQGLYFILDKPVKTKEAFNAAIQLIPKNLKEKRYKIQKVKEIDGWFVSRAGISIVAIKKGTNKLIFGYQW